MATVLDPTLALAGDLNGDGQVDLLYDTPSTLSRQAVLHPLLADGKGGYLPGQDVTLPSPLISRCRLGDLNGDGSPDLMCVAQSLSSSMGVLLGNGDGTFGPVTLYSPPGSPTCDAAYPAAIADLDGDGHADVMTSCQNQASLFVYLGDGKGHLTAIAPTRSYATKVTVADLNGDGKPDLVTQAISSMSTEVLFGNGDGTFTHAAYPSGNSGAVLADVDGDGHLDLIGGGLGILRIFHGNADGSFGTTPMGTVDFSDGTTTAFSSDGTGFGVYLSPLACADLNGDGIPDIVSQGNNGLTILLGQPGLKFAAPRSYPVGASLSLTDIPTSEQLADLDGDGHLDYLSVGPNGLYISYGRADGSFLSADVYPSGLGVTGVTLADFDENGTADAVTSGDTQLYLSQGGRDGTFGTAAPIPGKLAAIANTSFEGFASVTHGDINGDGHQDLVAVGSYGTNTALYSLQGHGDGTFGMPALIQPLGPFTSVAAVKDVNDDGRDDVIVLNNGSPASIRTLLSQSDGSFRPTSTALTMPSSESFGQAISVSDVNGDGIPDLLYASSAHLAVATGVGDGSFRAPIFYSLPALPSASSSQGGSVAAGDFDGDGSVDIAVLVSFSPAMGYYSGLTEIATLYRQGSGTALDANSFQANADGPVSKRYYSGLQAVDLDGDGVQDVLATSYEPLYVPDAVGVFRGQRTRIFADEAVFTAGVAENNPAIADLNHDGRPDLVSANVAGNAFTVLLSQGDALATGTLMAAPDPVTLGSSFTLTATVGAGGQSGPLQGTVAFSIDGVLLGSTAFQSGVASFPGPSTLAPGRHRLSAVTSPLTTGTQNFPSVTLQGTETVNLLPVSVTLNAAPKNVVAGQSLTLQAHVGNVAGAEASLPTPGGAVTILLDGIPAGTGGSGDASGVLFLLPTSFAATGTHTVTATYGGDGTHASGSASLSLAVGAATVTGTYKLGATPAAVTVSSGQQASIALDIASVGGFQGTVTLGYDTLPDSVTATLSTNAVSLHSGTHGAATLVLTTGVTQPQTPRRGRYARSGMAAAGLGGLLLLPFLRRRKALPSLLLAVVAAALLSGLSGCGSVGEPLGGSTGLGVFHITVIGNTAGSATPQTQDITLTVTQ